MQAAATLKKTMHPPTPSTEKTLSVIGFPFAFSSVSRAATFSLTGDSRRTQTKAESAPRPCAASRQRHVFCATPHACRVPTKNMGLMVPVSAQSA